MMPPESIMFYMSRSLVLEQPYSLGIASLYFSADSLEMVLTAEPPSKVFYRSIRAWRRSYACSDSISIYYSAGL